MPKKKIPNEFTVFPERLKELMSKRTVQKKDGRLRPTSQQELADYLTIKRQTVSLYITGQSIPDALQIRKIAQFFGISTDWLLGVTNDPKKKPSAIDELGLSHNAIMEIKNLGNGKYKETLNAFITADEFGSFIYQLWEISDCARLHHLDNLAEGTENDMDFNATLDKIRQKVERFQEAEDHVRERLGISDAKVVYGDFLLDLLKMKLQDRLNEIVTNFIDFGKTRAEIESSSKEAREDG